MYIHISAYFYIYITEECVCRFVWRYVIVQNFFTYVRREMHLHVFIWSSYNVSYTGLYIYQQTSTHTPTHSHSRARARAHTHTHTHTHIYRHTHTHTYTHIHTHTHTHTYTHAHTHVHTHMYVRARTRALSLSLSPYLSLNLTHSLSRAFICHRQTKLGHSRGSGERYRGVHGGG